MRLVVYLGDLLLLNENEKALRSDLKMAVSLLESLGFLINWEKSHCTPTQALDGYLGVIVDSISLSFSIPRDKIVTIQSLCLKLLSSSLVSLRELASLLGSLVWAILSVPYAQAHYRSLQNFFISSSRNCNNDLSKKCALSDQARQDLQWWASSLESVNGKSFTPLDPDIVIHSDASLTGWGACSNGLTTRGPWTKAERSLHINELELIGAFNAIKSFASSSRKIFIRIFLDNNTAVCYLNKHGGTKSRNLTAIAMKLSEWCESREIVVEAIYLPGKLRRGSRI